MDTILIVDDEVHIRRVYNKLFSEEGYRTLEASNAVNALDLLKKGGIDLILLDINMYDITGDTLYDIVSLFYKRIKVIVSSVCYIEDQKKIIEGAFDYYNKSDGINTLLLKVEKALKEKAFFMKAS
ncbi:MAG: response regulator [bacterium]|nr:response regulator [bacterium]